MDALAPLLGRSPRALKRFINTYRLIKVRAEDPVAYLRDDPPLAPYRSVLLLLALSTGTPHTAAAFLDQVLGGDGGNRRGGAEGRRRPRHRLAGHHGRGPVARGRAQRATPARRGGRALHVPLARTTACSLRPG